MKKTLFFAAALLLFSIGNAQIANGRIGNGNINIAGTEWTNVYGIDFNNDGVLEFRLSDFSGATGTQTNAYISYNWNGNNPFLCVGISCKYLTACRRHALSKSS